MSTSDRIMDFIREEIGKKGYPPTVREIGDAVGLASSSTVQGHLERLEEKGLIRRDPHKPRAIELLEPPERKVPTAEIERVIDYLEAQRTIELRNEEFTTANAYEVAVEELRKVLA